MRKFQSCIGLALPLLLAGCVVAPPAGAGVTALPGQGKTFQAFQQDDAACRFYAQSVGSGASPSLAAASAGLGSAAPAAAAGAAAGTNKADAPAEIVPREYDIAYGQCMAAKGDKVEATPAGYYAYGYPYAYAPYPYYAYPTYAYPYDYWGPGVSFAWGGGWGHGRYGGRGGHWRGGGGGGGGRHR